MIFLTLLAILPVILLLFFIYAKDSYEKEPPKLLVGLVFLGIVSAIPAVLLEDVAAAMINPIFGVPQKAPSYAYHFITAFLGVALIEEFVKFMAAYFPTWNHPAFNFKFDGIVYCFFASMGFAMIENILYVLGAKGNSGLGLAIGRALLAIPAHGMFSVFMGYYYGEAKYAKITGNKSGVTKNLLRGFITAMVLHGFYDFCLFTQDLAMIVIFFIFVIIADIYTIRVILNASKKNTALYNMPVYQQYWVNPAPGYGQPGLMNPAYAGGAAPYGQPPMGQNPYGQAPQQQFGQAPMGQNTYAQGAAPQQQFGQAPMGQNAYGQAPQQQFGQAPMGQNTYAQGAAPQQQFNQPQAAQNQNPYAPDNMFAPSPVEEQTTAILRREPPRMIYCPKCGNVCNFNSFFCGKCATPIHNFAAQG